MLDRLHHPKFLDILYAAIVTLWLALSVCLCIYFMALEKLTLLEAVASSLFLLFFGGTPLFLFGGLISFPMWWICRHHYGLNKNRAAIIGGLAGVVIAAFIIFIIPTDFSGTIIGVTYNGGLTFILTITFGAVAGWNGYRVASNRQLRRKAPKE